MSLRPKPEDTALHNGISFIYTHAPSVKLIRDLRGHQRGLPPPGPMCVGPLGVALGNMEVNGKMVEFPSEDTNQNLGAAGR